MENFDKKNKLVQDFLKVQEELSLGIKLENSFSKEDIHYIAGVDLAYWDLNKENYGICCIVIIDFSTKEIVEKVWSYGEITIPYIPGFLAFRELPLVIEAVKKLKIQPDIYMFDGNGYLHFRHMGIATHASFILNKPTIGVAKSYLKVNDVDFTMPENKQGAFTDIIINDKTYGRSLRTTRNVKPIFVSCGNWIDLETSTEIVMSCINKESRLPIPVRMADLETHKKRKKLLNNEKIEDVK